MKKYLPGLIAILFAVGAVAFTTPKINGHAPNKTSFSDPCSESSKQWYMIRLQCATQTSPTDVRNPVNYDLSNWEEMNYTCGGWNCVCAIWACPKGSNVSKPDISSNTTIYTALYNFFQWGMISGDIATKDQIYSTERRR